MRSPMSDRSRQRLRTILTILVTALIIAPATALASHSFSDVSDSDFYHAAVDWMKDNGVTVGCNPPTNTQYCPEKFVTRGEMAVFLERLDTEGVFVRPGDDAVDGGNADTVDGMHAADFLGATDKATDADLLDGKDSTEFLGATATATDSELLDGKDSTEFAGRLFAVVAADGTLVRGNRATSASRQVEGNYQVVFDRDVTDCAYMATIGSTDSGSTQGPGSISVVGLGSDANGVFVDTEDLSDAQSDRAFHLQVIC